uniref:(northern house mosquito) hypothetical protein n=1 Tax=Culex pipiens TaxID=7175 RepID=A0A8D8ALI1_CULPI
MQTHTRTIKHNKQVAVLKSCAEIICAYKDTVLHTHITIHRRVKGSRVTAKFVDPWDKPKSKLSPINDHKTNTARIHERERERAGRNDEDDDRKKRGPNRSRTLGPQITTPIETSASMRRPTATRQTVGDFKFKTHKIKNHRASRKKIPKSIVPEPPREERTEVTQTHVRDRRDQQLD